MVQMAEIPPQSSEDGDEHNGTGDDLDEELTHVGEGVGPESSDDRVDDGNGAGEQDSPEGRNIGENLEEYSCGGPFCAYVEDLKESAAPGEHLLRGEIIAGDQILERRDDA